MNVEICIYINKTSILETTLNINCVFFKKHFSLLCTIVYQYLCDSSCVLITLKTTWWVHLTDWPDWPSNPAHVSSGCWAPHWQHWSEFFTTTGHSHNTVTAWPHGKQSVQTRLWRSAKMCSLLDLELLCLELSLSPDLSTGLVAPCSATHTKITNVVFRISF